MTKHLFLIIFGCAAASNASAQQMYKSVAPDGKITFSDRPAYEKTKKLSVMRSYVLRPVEDHKLASEQVAQKKPGPVMDPNATVTPDIEDAMVNVMSMTEFVRKFAPTCSMTNAGSKAFAAAAAQWKKRNLAYIEHQQRLLMEVVSPNKRAELQDRAAGTLADLGKGVPATAEGRKEWCDGTIVELQGSQSDINKPAMLTVPITKYKAK